jgi:hypothetical protein
MPKALDKSGQKVGKLLLTKRLKKDNITYYECLCDCGEVSLIRDCNLFRSKTISCGCVKRELLRKRNTKHSQCTSRIYQTWAGMIQRCYNPNSDSHPNYGGRGIKIDESWKEFSNFLSWAKSSGYGDDLTIERKDVNRDYCPENCMWISKGDQGGNKRKYKNNTSGVTGVRLNKGESWVCTWMDKISKKELTKSFSIKRYGYDEAFNLACKYRKNIINDLKNQGVYYGENHGL